MARAFLRLREKKMEVNGKKLDLHYSIGADIEIDDELTKVAAPDFATYVQKKGTAKAYIKIAGIMNKWACIKNGKEDAQISEKEMMTLDAAELEEIIEEVIGAFKAGQHREIETKEPKNAESAGA